VKCNRTGQKKKKKKKSEGRPSQTEKACLSSKRDDQSTLRKGKSIRGERDDKKLQKSNQREAERREIRSRIFELVHSLSDDHQWSGKRPR